MYQAIYLYLASVPDIDRRDTCAARTLLSEAKHHNKFGYAGQRIGLRLFDCSNRS